MITYNSKNTLFALALVVALATTVAPAFAEDAGKAPCSTKTERPASAKKSGLARLFSGIGNLLKRDHSPANDDYIDSEPTDQFPISG